jgi:hypothetical protein
MNDLKEKYPIGTLVVARVEFDVYDPLIFTGKVVNVQNGLITVRNPYNDKCWDCLPHEVFVSCVN